jgi:hypothetical protein
MELIVAVVKRYRPSPDKSASRNVAIPGLFRAKGCDFWTGSMIVLRPKVDAEGCPRLNEAQGLSAHISGQSEPLQPVSRAQSQQATISPTTLDRA